MVRTLYSTRIRAVTTNSASIRGVVIDVYGPKPDANVSAKHNNADAERHRAVLSQSLHKSDVVAEEH